MYNFNICYITHKNYYELEQNQLLYNFVCENYNCALDKNIDRHHMHDRDDAGLSELRSKIENNYICTDCTDSCTFFKSCYIY
jgi:hypothetical protein